jgi:predicted nucleotidyltransferase
MAEPTSRPKTESNSVEQNLSNIYVPKGKLGNLPIANSIQSSIEEKMKKEADKTKQDIDKFTKELKTKYKFVEAIGIIPSQANAKIEEEYEIAKEEAEKKLIHICVIIPENQFKNLQKIKAEVIALAKKHNEKIWAHIMTPVDVWNLGLDSKFDIFEAVAMSFPVFDKGLLGAIRVAMIHRTLVLKKFEKYVTSYIIAGSLVRGEAKKTSDVDVFIIIDDTDVKRMSRLEIREKLRSIIYSYISEATAMAGVGNILNVQVALLTEFWERVRDAEPVAFTFLRDGVPLYDRAVFLPWKSLLRMGKIKPTPEAIDMFMSAGEKMGEMTDRKMLDIVLHDLYWGISTPTQGLLMIYGLTPSTPKETVKAFREIFVEKEKLVEARYADILEEIVIKYYKGFEHGKIKKVSGQELEKLVKDSVDYYSRLKELRKQIEKRVEEKSITKLYEDVFGMLRPMLKKDSEVSVINEFENKMIKTGKFPKKYLDGLKFLVKVKKELESDEKTSKKEKKKDLLTGKEVNEVEKARRSGTEIINALVEYNQRCDFLSMDRTRFIIKGSKKTAEVFFLKNTFLVEGEKIQKISGEKLIASNSEDLQKELSETKKESKIDLKSLEILKKSFGDFELMY